MRFTWQRLKMAAEATTAGTTCTPRRSIPWRSNPRKMTSSPMGAAATAPVIARKSSTPV